MKKILLCWNYERRSWVTQFERIFKPGEYVFINFFSKELESNKATAERVLYWNDFKSVDHLIDELDPGKVVFMGLDSPYSFLLNDACKRRFIPTYFLQHGIFHSFRAYLYEEERMKMLVGTVEHSVPVPKVRRNNVFFLFSYRFSRSALYLDIIKFLFIKKFSHSVQKALQYVAGKRLHTDHYIVYTSYLSKIFLERDNVSVDKMIEIGNEEANQLIDLIRRREDYSFTEGEYFLFIDEAFTGSEKFLLAPIVPCDQYNHFLKTLSDYAKAAGKRLKVKLHPFSYDVTHFVKDDNIDYLRDTDIADLIAKSCGVFGFSSTLLIPAIYVKRACLFKLNDFSDIHQALKGINYCRVLDFHGFREKDISFNDQLTESQANEFIKYFLFKLDNKCDDRLQMILRSN